MEIEYKDEAINLVTINDDGLLEISIEGITFLSSLKQQKVSHPPSHLDCNTYHYWPKLDR